MKTVKEIEEKLAEFIYASSPDEAKEVKFKKSYVRKRLEFLRTCKLYLETNPSEEFVKSELNRLKTRLNFIRSAMPECPKPGNEYAEKKHKAEYEKLYEVSKISKQIRTLQFILK